VPHAFSHKESIVLLWVAYTNRSQTSVRRCTYIKVEDVFVVMKTSEVGQFQYPDTVLKYSFVHCNVILDLK
jgi:hypothetical protein